MLTFQLQLNISGPPRQVHTTRNLPASHQDLEKFCSVSHTQHHTTVTVVIEPATILWLFSAAWLSAWPRLLRPPGLRWEDIGEEDRLLSRLEGEMTVESEHHADFTMSILDKGNGKAHCASLLVASDSEKGPSRSES